MAYAVHRRIRHDVFSHYLRYRKYIYRPIITPNTNGIFNDLENIVDSDKTAFGAGDLVAIYPYGGLPIIQIVGRQGNYSYSGRELWS